MADQELPTTALVAEFFQAETDASGQQQRSAAVNGYGRGLLWVRLGAAGTGALGLYQIGSASQQNKASSSKTQSEESGNVFHIRQK